MLIKCLHTSRTEFGRTNTIIHRLMHAAIQTGVFCTAFALATLITFRKDSLPLVLLDEIASIGGWPQTNFFAIFSFPMGRVYTNVSFLKAPQNSALSNQTLMDTLNVRHTLRDVLKETRAVCISTYEYCYPYLMLRRSTSRSPWAPNCNRIEIYQTIE